MSWTTAALNRIPGYQAYTEWKSNEQAICVTERRVQQIQKAVQKDLDQGGVFDTRGNFHPLHDAAALEETKQNLGRAKEIQQDNRFWNNAAAVLKIGSLAAGWLVGGLVAKPAIEVAGSVAGDQLLNPSQNLTTAVSTAATKKAAGTVAGKAVRAAATATV